MEFRGGTAASKTTDEQVVYLKTCLREANKFLASAGYCIHYDVDFIPRKKWGQATSFGQMPPNNVTD